MLAALIIVFREVFEAGLIVGIVMAVTRTVARRSWWIAVVLLAVRSALVLWRSSPERCRHSSAVPAKRSSMPQFSVSPW
jgi:hypothetical protein